MPQSKEVSKVEKMPERDLINLYTPLSEEFDESVTAQPTVFTYGHDFDTNGILYHIATKGKRENWSNPADAGQVSVTSRNELQFDSLPASSVVGRSAVRCVYIFKLAKNEIHVF